jgi:hypothetical protein
LWSKSRTASQRCEKRVRLRFACLLALLLNVCFRAYLSYFAICLRLVISLHVCLVAKALGIPAEEYLLLNCSFGQDVIPLDDEKTSLQKLEVRNESTVLVRAPVG